MVKDVSLQLDENPLLTLFGIMVKQYVMSAHLLNF